MPYKNPENQKAASRRWYLRNKKKQALKSVVHSRVIRQEVYEYKESNPCADCGGYFPFYVMQFDHVRGVKRANVGDLLNRNCSRKFVREERAKCDLVCANCHCYRTYIRNRNKSKQGTKAVTTYSALEHLVIDWASQRKIIPNSNPTAQLMKTMSELGELADATLKEDWKGIEDGVGDVLVTLILYCRLQDLSLVDCLNTAYEQIKDRKGTLTEDGVFVKEVES